MECKLKLATDLRKSVIPRNGICGLSYDLGQIRQNRFDRGLAVSNTLWYISAVADLSISVFGLWC